MHNLLNKLYRKILDEKVRLRISGNGIVNKRGEEGIFIPNNLQIEVFRERGLNFVTQENSQEVANNCQNPINELFVLSHEFGHYFSYKNKKRLQEYDSIISLQWSGLSTEQKKLILKEEIIAWKYAEIILKELGFLEFNQFYNKQKESLNEYCRRLNIDLKTCFHEEENDQNIQFCHKEEFL